MQQTPCRALLVWAHNYPSRLFMEAIGVEFWLPEWMRRHEPIRSTGPVRVGRARARKIGGGR
jgi:hypothetical protein